MFSKMKSFLQQEINTIKDDGLFKDERIIVSPQDANIEVFGGKKVLNLCANNYLGLASHPEIIKAARSSYDDWGYGLSSVRFICGTQEIHKTLENKMIERTVEVKRLIKQKSKFIDSLSHDLGTPLTPLVTLLPTIKEQIENEDVKDMIETCIRNVEYMRRIVDNTRELAELSSRDFLLKKENLFEIINELEQKYEFIFKSYNIEFENNIKKEIFIKTERLRLLKLFDHITSNAVNSMIETGGKIIFESKPIKKETGNFIQISISDTGTGLSRTNRPSF